MQTLLLGTPTPAPLVTPKLWCHWHVHAFPRLNVNTLTNREWIQQVNEIHSTTKITEHYTCLLGPMHVCKVIHALQICKWAKLCACACVCVCVCVGVCVLCVWWCMAERRCWVQFIWIQAWTGVYTHTGWCAKTLVHEYDHVTLVHSNFAKAPHHNRCNDSRAVPACVSFLAYFGMFSA